MLGETIRAVADAGFVLRIHILTCSLVARRGHFVFADSSNAIEFVTREVSCDPSSTRTGWRRKQKRQTNNDVF